MKKSDVQRCRTILLEQRERILDNVDRALFGERDLDPAWSFGPEGERFEVEVTGDPSSKLTFHGWHPESIAAGLERNPGIVATATHCVSAIPYACRAEPGIRTYLDLPLVAGRAAPSLARSAS